MAGCRVKPGRYACRMRKTRRQTRAQRAASLRNLRKARAALKRRKNPAGKRRAAAHKRLLRRATAKAKANKVSGGKFRAFLASLRAQVRLSRKSGIKRGRASRAVAKGILLGKRKRKNPAGKRRAAALKRITAKRKASYVRVLRSTYRATGNTVWAGLTRTPAEKQLFHRIKLSSAAQYRSGLGHRFSRAASGRKSLRSLREWKHMDRKARNPAGKRIAGRWIRADKGIQNDYLKWLFSGRAAGGRSYANAKAMRRRERLARVGVRVTRKTGASPLWPSAAVTTHSRAAAARLNRLWWTPGRGGRQEFAMPPRLGKPRRKNPARRRTKVSPSGAGARLAKWRWHHNPKGGSAEMHYRLADGQVVSASGLRRMFMGKIPGPAQRRLLGIERLTKTRRNAPLTKTQRKALKGILRAHTPKRKRR